MRCSHLTCVFFFLTFPFFVSLKYLSLLVLHSNKSCVSREGNANTDGRIRVGVARFVGVLLFLESLSVCVSLSVSLIRLRFRGNDDDEKNVKEMMMILR